MKIIFLDIDGVITSARTGWMNWDPFTTTFLKWVCETIDVKIVISSTWRCNRDRKFFADIFSDDIIHEDWRTPWDLSDYTMNKKGDEIQRWLDNHPEIEQYLILDDDSDMLPSQIENLILTDSYNGIQFEDMERIREFFGIQDQCINMNLPDLILHPNFLLIKICVNVFGNR